MKLGFPLIACFVLSSLLLAPSWLAGKREAPRATSGEEFFIVSSIDTKKKQLVLKRPTEVTELAQVTEKSVYLDERGKPIRFTDLRAGDTVYVVVSPGSDGIPIVTRVRKGPMTPEELHSRYLDFKF